MTASSTRAAVSISEESQEMHEAGQHESTADLAARVERLTSRVAARSDATSQALRAQLEELAQALRAREGRSPGTARPAPATSSELALSIPPQLDLVETLLAGGFSERSEPSEPSDDPPETGPSHPASAPEVAALERAMAEAEAMPRASEPPEPRTEATGLEARDEAAGADRGDDAEAADAGAWASEPEPGSSSSDAGPERGPSETEVAAEPADGEAVSGAGACGSDEAPSFEEASSASLPGADEALSTGEPSRSEASDALSSGEAPQVPSHEQGVTTELASADIEGVARGPELGSADLELRAGLSDAPRLDAFDEPHAEEAERASADDAPEALAAAREEARSLVDSLGGRASGARPEDEEEPLERLASSPVVQRPHARAVAAVPKADAYRAMAAPFRVTEDGTLQCLVPEDHEPARVRDLATALGRKVSALEVEHQDVVAALEAAYGPVQGVDQDALLHAIASGARDHGRSGFVRRMRRWLTRES
jgi:hypothetical protein